MDNLLNFNSDNKKYVSYMRYKYSYYYGNSSTIYNTYYYSSYNNNLGYEPILRNHTPLNSDDTYYICKLSKLSNVSVTNPEFASNYKKFYNLTKKLSQTESKIQTNSTNGILTNYLHEYVSINLNLSIDKTIKHIKHLCNTHYKIKNNLDITSSDIDTYKQYIYTNSEGNISLNVLDTINNDDNDYNDYFRKIKVDIHNLLLSDDLTITKILSFTNNDSILEALVFMHIYLFHIYYKSIASKIKTNHVTSSNHNVVINSWQFWKNTNYTGKFDISEFDNESRILTYIYKSPKEFMEHYFKHIETFDEYVYLYSKHLHVRSLTQHNITTTKTTTTDATKATDTTIDPVSSIVAKLLDDISIKKLYNQPKYNMVYNKFNIEFTNSHVNASTDSNTSTNTDITDNEDVKLQFDDKLDKSSIAFNTSFNIIGYTQDIFSNIHNKMNYICIYVINPFLVANNLLVTTKVYKEYSILNKISKKLYSNIGFNDRVLYSSIYENKLTDNYLYYNENFINTYEYKYIDTLYLYYISNLFSHYYDNKKMYKLIINPDITYPTITYMNIDIYIDNTYYNKYFTLTDNKHKPSFKDSVINNYLNKILKIDTAFSITNTKNKPYTLNLLQNNIYQPWNSNNDTNYKTDITKFPPELVNIFNTINLDLFDYQKENTLWMHNIENNIKNNQHYIDNKILYLFMNTIPMYKINNYHVSTSNYNNIDIILYKINNLNHDNKNIYILSLIIDFKDYESRNYNYKYYIDISDYEEEIIQTNYNNYISTQMNLDTNIDSSNVTSDEYKLNYCIDKIIKKYINTKYESNYHIKGGFLCDDVGLGKTLSTITHCLHQLPYDNNSALPLINNNLTINKPITYSVKNGIIENKIEKWLFNNLIIVPSRLIKQWKFEIDKYSANLNYKPSVLTILSITDIKKFTKQNADLVSKNKDIIRPDFIIMSINLFNNTNYQKYLETSYTTIHKKRLTINPNYNIYKDYSYSVTDYFDIYQIQWNRIIIDEVHETITTTKQTNSSRSYNLSSTERKKTYALLTLLHTNYKWGLSATPFQNGSENKRAYTNWLIDTFKLLYHKLYIKDTYINNILNSDNVKLLNSFNDKFNITDIRHYSLTLDDNELYDCLLDGNYILALPFVDYTANDIKNTLSTTKTSTNYYVNRKGMSDMLFHDDNFKFINDSEIFFTDMDIYHFTKNTICKTSKTSVKKDIGLPIFTEEIKWIDLSNIESNIYNSAKSDIYYNLSRIYGNTNMQLTDNIDNRLLIRLFQICTNILVSEEDVSNMKLNNVTDNIVSLEDLNKNMIMHFKRKLTALTTERNKLISLISNKQSHKLLFECFIHVMTNVWSPNIDTLKNTYYSEYNSIDNYFNLFNNIINKLKGNKLNNLRNYINSNDIIKFSSYQVIYMLVMDAIDNYSNSIVNDCSHLALNSDEDNIYVHNAIEITNTIPNLEALVSLINDNIGNFRFSDSDTLNTSKLLSYKFITKKYKQLTTALSTSDEKLSKLDTDIKINTNQIKLFESNDFIKEKTDAPCSICWNEYENDTKVVITICRHVICGDCYSILSKGKPSITCPECRQDVKPNQVNVTIYSDIIKDNSTDTDTTTSAMENDTTTDTGDNKDDNNDKWITSCLNKYGTKMTELIKTLKELFKAERETENNRVIVFSQYENMLKLISIGLKEYNIKNVHISGNIHRVNNNIDKFKRDNSIRVIMLSSEHSNSGCNLTEANHIIFIDVINDNKEKSKDIECQAIGRSVRLGQQRPVKLIRFITKNTIEEEFYNNNKYDIATIQ
jgi:SNF2 family DNA or RNA helicase